MSLNFQINSLAVGVLHYLNTEATEALKLATATGLIQGNLHAHKTTILSMHYNLLTASNTPGRQCAHVVNGGRR